ncbi:MAG: Monoacylglycerol lipase [Nitrospirae bacterium]|nr:MAG: Alpha/beta hydrolase family protein [Nitrospira sp. OLB3]MBV6468668.1 Monoacylglycerol lipase [Nitrospirota bacterium]MCE7964003.1 alpha/beta fold hydrolase [Nitrospira sp. NTP2]MCK6492805.1 alpha/beta fold hydrolase [Nitrospira sp.]MEB2337147.1 alpha/beta fold hydrolase [Nitrospirales bacterium]
MEQLLSFQDRLGHRIAAVLATPDRPTDRVALLCHGFLSHKNSSSNLALTQRLTSRGVATFRFDCFGHGDSEGPFAKLTTTTGVGQTGSALDYLVNRGYRRLALVGSSFGGLLSILATAEWMTRHRSQPDSVPPLACLALKCPVVDFGEELLLELGEQGLQQWKATNSIPDLHGGPRRIPLDFAFYEDCLQRIAYEPARTITTPTLIAQGDADEYVPLHQSRRLLDALAGIKRLEILPGADHRFTRETDFERMLTLLTDWVIHHSSS